MPSLEKYILRIHRKLSGERLEERKIMKYLEELNRLQITLDALKATGIGKVVNRFRKHENEDIGEMASFLVTKWKELLTQETNESNHSSPSKMSPKEIPLLNSNHIQKDNIGCSSGSSEIDQPQHSKHAESKHKGSKHKQKVPSLQLCDVSFGCEPVNKKQKKRPSSTHAAPTKMTSSESSRVEPDLPPLPSAMSVSNSLLPDIQPSYKPIRFPEYGDGPSAKKKKGIVSGQVDEHALMSRKSRTQVFSGRRLPGCSEKAAVTSLYDLSMKVLIENIDALDDTGGVPYDILAPVLAKCTPQQLMHLEEFNPYFMEDTEELWKTHAGRDFKGTKPKPNQSWRELYTTNITEMDNRLKKINQKIQAAQAAKKPERQVLLAYAYTEAKPPRDVLRRQAKFGTGKRVHSVASVPGPSRSAPQALHRNHGSSPSKKQAAVPAPMMKKTMKLFKNQRSRATTSIRRT